MQEADLLSVPHPSLECGSRRGSSPTLLFAFLLHKALRDQDPFSAVPKHLAW